MTRLGNGSLSLMLAMVLLPLLEDTFNILTPMKLLELSDPGTPLMMKLLQKASGTFTHSLQVGTLADAATERIGANALLARGGGYYYDIGKMEHLAYFIENQIAQFNPHETLSPALSAEAIKRHVENGLKIGRAWSLPQEILDILAQHHGSTRIEYFYNEALEEAADGAEVNEATIRYSSGLPRGKAAGIVMLADSIEASVKTLPTPTPRADRGCRRRHPKEEARRRPVRRVRADHARDPRGRRGYPRSPHRLPRPAHRIPALG